MSDEKKKNNTFYITHKGELLIWLIILLVSVIVFFFTHTSKKALADEYSIFMQDVDGLIVGSPVRTMGIEIGHISKIKPMKDEVFIKFEITDKSVTIPRGTRATVEFSGMAGSKSLELYMPNKDTYIDSSVPLITVDPPKRLHDAVGLLNDMFKRIGNMIIVGSRFGKQINEIEHSINGGDINEKKAFLNYVDNIIDEAQKNADNFGRRFKDDKQK